MDSVRHVKVRNLTKHVDSLSQRTVVSSKMLDFPKMKVPSWLVYKLAHGDVTCSQFDPKKVGLH